MAENSMRDAILSVVEAKGGSADGVGPLDRDALDRLLDVMAGSDQPVTSGMSDAQVVRALAQYAHGGGGGAPTQTLTVTKGNLGDTVSVATMSWVDFIAGNEDATIEVQPDSTEGQVSVYSITVGAALSVFINDQPAIMYLDANNHTVFNTLVMPSTPLYATNTK